MALAPLLAGFGIKAGLMPFHGWLADAHSAAPGPVSAMFSGLMVNLGVIAIARVALDGYAVHRTALPTRLMVFGATSAILGAALALGQDELKRLLAYDTISQMAILLTATGAGTLKAVTGLTYHLIDHALFKTLLFLCAGAIVHATGMTRLSQMGGLARHRPVVTAAFLLGMASIAGLPPLNGYASLGLIHDALRVDHPAAFAAVLVAQVLTVAGRRTLRSSGVGTTSTTRWSGCVPACWSPSVSWPAAASRSAYCRALSSSTSQLRQPPYFSITVRTPRRHWQARPRCG
ncbi:complex I subunit 5 family protein [Kribbella sp. NPDC059898]|uniref:complex I subunit 5 family protein n=1 Tax=Kribbella sp. NPDC059898 TaxID=3346995 RepID=UPI003664FF9D